VLRLFNRNMPFIFIDVDGSCIFQTVPSERKVGKHKNLLFKEESSRYRHGMAKHRKKGDEG